MCWLPKLYKVMNVQMVRLRLILIAFFFIFQNNVFAQIQISGSPKYRYNHNYDVPYVSIHGSEIELHKQQALKANNHKNKKVAFNISTNIDVIRDGNWTQFGDTSICLIGISAKGAYSLGVIFEDFYLSQNSKLFIISPSAKKGALSHLNNKEYGKLAVAPLLGNEVVLELQVIGNATDNSLIIGEVSYGLDNMYENTWLLKSQPCNVDVNCFGDDEVRNIQKGVCKIIVNNTDLCSGTLINTTGDSARAFLITANHCIGNATEANKSVFIFNSEIPYCNGPAIPNSQQVSGSEIIATSDLLDMTLVELSRMPPYTYHPYLVGWSLDTTNILSTIAIHHPSGDYKKITVDNNPPKIESYATNFKDNAFWLIEEWDLGTTEGGSSGCSLLNNKHQIIGTLSGGDANCELNNNDYFARFDRMWADFELPVNQLKVWLDPVESGLKSINGRNPYDYIDNTNYDLSNISSNQNVTIQSLGDWGYLSGHNSVKYSDFAEHFYVTDSTSIIGFNINVAKAQKESLNGKVRIMFWNGQIDDEHLIFQKDFPIDYFRTGQTSFVEFDKFHKVYNDFYIGYKLFYLNEQDQFAVYHSEPTNGLEENTALVYHLSDGWIPLYQADNKEMSTSFDIRPVLNGSDPALYVHKQTGQQIIKLYPNPASNCVSIVNLKKGKYFYDILDIQGRIVKKGYVSELTGADAIYIGDLHSGMYLLKLKSSGAIFVARFIVRK